MSLVQHTAAVTMSHVQNWLQHIFAFDPNMSSRWEYSRNKKETKIRIVEKSNNTDKYPNNIPIISVARGGLTSGFNRLLNNNIISEDRSIGTRETLTFESLGIIINIKAGYVDTDFMLNYIKDALVMYEREICKASGCIMRIGDYRVSVLEPLKADKDEHTLFEGQLSFVCQIGNTTYLNEVPEEYYVIENVQIDIIKPDTDPAEVIESINIKVEI